jgi:hypothetical protein
VAVHLHLGHGCPPSHLIEVKQNEDNAYINIPCHSIADCFSYSFLKYKVHAIQFLKYIGKGAGVHAAAKKIHTTN